MNPIRIRTTITSDTLHLPELQPLVGRAVEITVRDDGPADDVRAEFYAELARIPQTEEVLAARRETLNRWRTDPRFAVYWPQIEYLLPRGLDHYRKWAEFEMLVQQIRDEGGIDEAAIHSQDECDLRHADDHFQ